MLAVLILICVSADFFVQAEIISNNDLDDFMLEEILRNTVSSCDSKQKSG
jgi:hypothetical protein